jgi:hypothetical protein
VPLGSAGRGDRRLAVMARAGAGPTIPHGESTIRGESRDGYVLNGLAVHGAAGLAVHLTGRLSGTVEYQFSRTRPTIPVAAGTAQMTASIHQFSAGVAIRLSR